MIADIEAMVAATVDRFNWDIKTAYDQDLDELMGYFKQANETDKSNGKSHRKKEESVSMADFIGKKGGVSSIL